MNSQELLGRLGRPFMGLAAMLGFASFLLISGALHLTEAAREVGFLLALVRWGGIPAALFLAVLIGRMRAGAANLALPLQIACQLAASCSLAIGLGIATGALDKNDYVRLALAGLLLAGTAWWCLEANYRYARWHSSVPVQPGQPVDWGRAAVGINVVLEFLMGRVGYPDEPHEVRRMRGKAMFFAVALPPAGWVALGSKLWPSLELLIVGPAIAWVVAAFIWITGTYGKPQNPAGK